MDIHVKCVLCLSSFNKKRHILTVLVKILSVVFYKNLSSGSHIVPCRQTDRQDKGTDMMKLIVTFALLCECP